MNGLNNYFYSNIWTRMFFYHYKAKNHLREFEERVFAIALTDSVHGLKQQEAEPEVVSFYKQVITYKCR